MEYKKRLMIMNSVVVVGEHDPIRKVGAVTFSASLGTS